MVRDGRRCLKCASGGDERNKKGTERHGKRKSEQQNASKSKDTVEVKKKKGSRHGTRLTGR